MRAVACVTKLFGGASSVTQTLPPIVEPRPIVIRPRMVALADEERGTMDLVAQAVERNAEAVEENDMQTRPGSGLGSKVLRAARSIS
ncbi:hypothetical protein ACVWZ6_000333 [Bradyrhizobium sp. GM6.1]